MNIPRNRRWYQFSLRTLLAVMTLASLGLAWLAYERNEVRKRQEAIAAIEESGGFVTHADTDIFRSCWREVLLGDDWEGEVVVAGIGPYATDAAMVPLARLTKLQGLYCDDTQITDAGLVHVARLKKLRMLSLPNTQVTDAGLVHLVGLSKLEQLNVNGTEVTEQGIRAFKRSLPNVVIARDPLNAKLPRRGGAKS